MSWVRGMGMEGGSPAILFALDLAFMQEQLPTLLRAALVTVQLSGLAVLLGIVVGLLLGSWRVIGPAWLQTLIQWFVNVVRGVPPLVHIAIIYFALPRLGLVLNEFWTGVAALTIIAAGYEVEIVRAALQSVEEGQTEAAFAVGMDRGMTLRWILLPQALQRMIPPLTNELANVIKASSLLSVISVKELTKVGNDLIFEHFVVAEVLIPVAILYVLIVSLLTHTSRWLEERLGIPT
ncbi:MAG: amino acid ABC transporter permease [Cyanobacteriota bacterium]|nr:amino acid ABC transporter permease [Cyanobacteriota bacterium]